MPRLRSRVRASSTAPFFKGAGRCGKSAGARQIPWRRSQVVRRRSAKPLYSGPNPDGASNKRTDVKASVRFCMKFMERTIGPARPSRASAIRGLPALAVHLRWPKARPLPLADFSAPRPARSGQQDAACKPFAPVALLSSRPLPDAKKQGSNAGALRWQSCPFWFSFRLRKRTSSLVRSPQNYFAASFQICVQIIPYFTIPLRRIG